MQSTTSGMNRTGAASSLAGSKAMMEAVNELTPPVPIDMTAGAAVRLQYIEEADAVGAIPPPVSLKGVMKSGVARLSGGSPEVLMDKIGERLAFERGGTRLYDALITKYAALVQAEGEVLSPAAQVLSEETDGVLAHEDESPAETLQRIRAEELSHFHMLRDAMTSLGGDPTAQTPCADVTTTASIGLIQVVTDPRTTFAQCLNAMLTAELTDNAGWELLIQLADEAGATELTGQFLAALGEEQQHLAIVKGWLARLVSENAGTPAV
jgi:rubrerythrin